MVNLRTPYLFQDLVQELDRMTRDMDWAFGETTKCPDGSRSGLRVGEKEAVLEMDLPGVATEDLHIELENEQLQVKASRSDLHTDGEDVVLRERTYGEFHRSYRLPWPVKADAVQAQVENGVLRVVLQKAPEAEPRRILIQNGSNH